MSICIVCVCLSVAGQPPHLDVARPEPRGETIPVPHRGDSADDPAIWVHPSKPDKGLILGTNKKGGLHVYDFDGRELQVVDVDSRPNNVDILYDFPLAKERVDLAVVSSRHENRPGLKAYKIDPESRQLQSVLAGEVHSFLDGSPPYGLCTYRSSTTGKGYVFANRKDGNIVQYEVVDGRDGNVHFEKVRSFAVPSQPEGMVADCHRGVIYVGEEKKGIWMFPAEPDGGTRGEIVVKVGEHGLAADVEGLAIYRAAPMKGYLIASSQGNHTFKVYELGGAHRFLLTIDPAPGRFGKPTGTDGIAVSNAPAGRQFPRGLFVVQDGRAGDKEKVESKAQNFKLYGWEDIAGKSLVVSPEVDPRR